MRRLSPLAKAKRWARSSSPLSRHGNYRLPRRSLHTGTLPQLNSTISKWFRAALRATSAKVIPIQQTIAVEAAEVPVATGHKDPGDCYLIATSRVRKIPIITRDPVMRNLATDGYLDVIVC
ncbi:MAG: PIN domain-containing protein [Roseiarcus sp.]